MSLIFATLFLLCILVLNVQWSFGFGCGTGRSIHPSADRSFYSSFALIFAVKPITVLGMLLGA